MRIESSAQQWQTQHSESRLQAHSQQLSAWVGERPSANANRSTASSAAPRPPLPAQTPAQAPAASQAHISAEAARRAQDFDAEAGLTPLLRMVSDLIERMTGVSARIMPLPPLGQAPAAAAPTAASSATDKPSSEPSNAPERPGWGAVLQERHVYAESESLQLALQGSIKTNDGREINFQLQLHMQRSYYEESSSEIRLGNARATDPLVINLDASAAQLQELRFAFDLHSDGKAEQVPLLSGNRGFLALDRNGNGRIDNGSELFGPASGNGFSELALYDEDGNGWIDEGDSVFQRLRIWTPDANGAGRLQSLQEAGVGALSLAAATTAFALRGSANQALGSLRATSAYVNENGSVGTLQQVDLAA